MKKLLLPTFLLATLLPAVASAASKPNIVLVLMDNFGWGELGTYGGGILRGAPTPRIDRVALDPTFAQTVVGERVLQRLIDSGALGFRLSDPDDAVVAGVRISVDF